MRNLVLFMLIFYSWTLHKDNKSEHFQFNIYTLHGSFLEYPPEEWEVVGSNPGWIDLLIQPGEVIYLYIFIAVNFLSN